MSSSQQPHSSRPERSASEQVRLGAAGVLLVILAIFVLKNTDRTRVDFVFTDVRMPLIFVLIGTAVVGAATSHLLMWVYRRRRNRDDN